MNAVTTEDLDEEGARTIFENYCALRAQKIAGLSDEYDGVQVKIYFNGGFYTMTGSNGEVNLELTEDD